MEKRVVFGPGFETVLYAARAGAEWAWTKIYRDLSPAVLRYLELQRAPDPEDLLGEVFVRMVNGLPRFEGSEPEFRAWVFKCARSVAVDAWRRAGRRPVDFLPPESLAEIAGSADSAIAQSEARDRVRTLLAVLTGEQREVMFLRFVADFSIEETARVLSKSSGSVKSLQSRAIAAIRRESSRKAVS